MPIEIKNSTDTSVDIMVTGDILDDSWRFDCDNYATFDTYPTAIKELLDGADGKDVNVHINSGGGDIFAGFAIHNMLRQHNGTTTAYIDGVSASSASIIAFGCDKIKIPSNAFLMIHKPMWVVSGNADDFTKAIEVLDTVQRGLTESYVGKALEGVTREQISKFIDDETWFTGQDAGKYFNVEVLDAVKVSNVYDVREHKKDIPDNVLNTLENWKKTASSQTDKPEPIPEPIPEPTPTPDTSVDNNVDKVEKIKKIRVQAMLKIAK